MLTSLNEKNDRKCVMSCKDSHPIFMCPRFKKSSVCERNDIVKKFNLCWNCLKNSHGVRQCPHNSFCKDCNNENSKKHNYLLCKKRDKFPGLNVNDYSSHNSLNNNASPNLLTGASQGQRLSQQRKLNPEADVFQSERENFAYAVTSKKEKMHIIPTAMIAIKKRGDENEALVGRALIDTASEVCFLSSSFAERLRLKKEKINLSVKGITGNSIDIKYRAFAVIFNDTGDYRREIEFYIISKITSLIPRNFIDVSGLNIPKNLKLADMDFNKPCKVDILLNSEVSLDLMREGKFYIPNSNLVLLNSAFGFIIGGSATNNLSTCSQVSVHCGTVNEVENLNRELRKFWEIEQVTYKKIKSAEEIEANEHFLKTYSRDSTGKFVVQMPLKKDPCMIGDSKSIALSKLNSLWNRLRKNPELLALYRQFLSQYEDMKHMEEVVEYEEPDIKYYIPHIPVYRPEKISTPCRVVFNASQESKSGESLNSIQINGGVIQDDLVTIILRFRQHICAFIADVKMMFRMIWVHPSQRDLQRILWKDDTDDQIKTYRLCTVTYGTKSAPYLAQRCLQQLGEDGESQFPLAAKVVQTQVYMDDVLTGSKDLSSAKELKKQLIELFSTCGMELHKWESNCQELRKDANSSQDYEFDNTKALGLLWKPREDTFSYNISFEILDYFSQLFTKKQMPNQNR